MTLRIKSLPLLKVYGIFLETARTIFFKCHLYYLLEALKQTPNTINIEITEL